MHVVDGADAASPLRGLAELWHITIQLEGVETSCEMFDGDEVCISCYKRLESNYKIVIGVVKAAAIHPPHIFGSTGACIMPHIEF